MSELIPWDPVLEVDASGVLDTALDLVAEGVSVIPLRPRSKVPALERWAEFQTRLPTEDEVRSWFADPALNLGVVCGPVSGGLYVLDFDTPEAAQKFAEVYAPLLTGAPIVKTARGFHAYLRSTVPLSGRKADGIDLKAAGGYVVGPRSTHPDGSVYQLVHGDLAKIPEVDPELVGFGSNGHGKQEPPGEWADEVLARGADKGARNDTLARLAGRYVAKGLSRAEALELLLQFDRRCRPPLGERTVTSTLESVLKTHDRKHPEPPDPLEALVSLRSRQTAELPPRTWFAEGMVTPGFNVIFGRKAMGKSFFMVQLAHAIAEGLPFLDRPTTPAKVLYVSFELDERDTADRFKALAPLSENAYIVHGWPPGEKALPALERAITAHGFQVIMFDTFMTMLPRDPQARFDINNYFDSEYYRAWRMTAKKHDAAVVGSWHATKADREDIFLNLLSGTGFGGQCDCAVEIKRKRGDAAGKLVIAGNHAADAVVPVLFEDGVFSLGEGELDLDRLSPDEERTVAVLREHPSGCSPTAVGLATGRSDNAARAALNRLIARGKVERPARGVYALVTL